MTATNEKNFDYEVEEKSLIGFDLELIKIEDFKAYYKNCNTFTPYSEKKFLSAVKIPPQFYLEQPEETKKDLLDNKEVIISAKLKGKYILVVKKDNTVENCVRLDYNKAMDIYERIKLQNEKKLTPVRDFIKDGYISNFISVGELKKGEYNLGIFIDYPIMLNKNPKVSEGFYYVPTDKEALYKSMYVSTIEVDFNDYQTLDLFIGDALKSVVNLKEDKVFESLKDSLLLRDIDEMLVKLSEAKVLSKGYVTKIGKYIDKAGLQLPTVLSLIDLLLGYDLNFKSYRVVAKLRSCKEGIEKIIKGGSNG